MLTTTQKKAIRYAAGSAAYAIGDFPHPDYPAWIRGGFRAEWAEWLLATPEAMTAFYQSVSRAIKKRERARATVKSYQWAFHKATEAMRAVPASGDRYCGRALVYIEEKHPLALALMDVKSAFRPTHWHSRMFAAAVDFPPIPMEDSQSMTDHEARCRAAAAVLVAEGIPARVNAWAD